MAKTGLQNETLISELLISGSSSPAISRNEFGVYSFDQANRADGVISGQLTRPKYNETELVKSVDTVIFELLPPEAPPFDDRVPRPIYNEVTQSVIDLTEQVIDLTTLVFQLRAKVQDVEIVSESLRVDLDLQNLNVAASQNQTQQLTTKITSTITELQNSIQKGTAEAIQRVSLFARNQALEQELEVLRETLIGKESKQAEGAQVGQDISVKVTTKGQADGDDLLVNTRPGKDKGNVKWINGPEIEVYNFTSAPVTVSFETAGKTKDAYGKPASFTLEAKARKLVTVPTNKDGVLGLNVGKDTLYAGSFLIKTTTSTITLTAGLQLQRGAKFKP
jgi:hypothetical protein